MYVSYNINIATYVRFRKENKYTNEDESGGLYEHSYGRYTL